MWGLADGVGFRTHDKELLDVAGLLEAFGILLGGGSGEVIAESNFVKAGLMFEIVGIQVFGVQRPR